jgi:hypothetical protein
MAKRSLYSFEIKPETLASLRFLENHVLTMPNRIENIRISAANHAVRSLKGYLRSNYGSAGRGMDVTSRNRGGYIKLVIKAQAAKASSGKVKGQDASNFAANILLYGRKSYTSRRGPGGKSYKLRQASTPPYPAYLSSFKVKSMSPNHSARTEIRKKASSILIKSIEMFANRQGFGVRGGNPTGMGDTPHMSRSKTPSSGVNY